MVSVEFYTDIYGGIQCEDIEDCLKRAEAIIECFISSLPETGAQETLYKKAVCAQAEQMALAGGVQGWLESTAGSAVGVTLGSFHTESSKGGQAGGGSSSADSSPCSAARMYLERAGLVYRGAEAL